jgi:hypothetical protein
MERKSEYRISKQTNSQINSKPKKIQNTEPEYSLFGTLHLFQSFEFVSDFEFRASDLPLEPFAP